MSFCLKKHCQNIYNQFISAELPHTLLSTSFGCSSTDLLIIMRQVSSLKADQLELTSACLSSFRLMKPLRSASTVWNHWYASGLTPGGMLPTKRKDKGNNRVVKRRVGFTLTLKIPHHFWRLLLSPSLFSSLSPSSICLSQLVWFILFTVFYPCIFNQLLFHWGSQALSSIEYLWQKNRSRDS